MERTGRITMRLIDADAIKLEKGFFEKVDNVPTFYEWLGKQPTVDAVQVVRCEECVYRRRCMLQHFVESNAVDSTKIDWNEWYCADGVRDINVPSKS